MSLFAASLIAIVAILGVADATRDDRDPRRVIVAALGLIVAAATRDLLWIYVGFEAYSLATTPFRVRTALASSVTLGGVLVVAIASRATDLAALEATTAANVGVLLFVLGLVIKWLQSKSAPIPFVAGSIALVVVLVRIQAWAPETAGALASAAWLAGVSAVLAGGVGAALSPTTRPLALWLTVSSVGLAVLGLGSGAAALSHVLAHVAASTIVLALVLTGAPTVATWLTMLSLASVPPFPGFVSKLGLMAGLPTPTLSIVCSGLVLAAFGCVRELDRAPTPPRRWVTLASLAAVLLLGLFPDGVLALATRAAAGLF